MRKVLATMGLVFLILATAGSLFAQTSNGQVGGVVQDPTKALIPGLKQPMAIAPWPPP